MCKLTANITSELHTTKILVSNNGFDESSSSATLTLTPFNQLISISPRNGAVFGGTPVALAFLMPVFETVYCHFSGTSLIAAYRVDDYLYACVSPPSLPGISKLSVSVQSSVIAQEEFTFLELPVFESVSPPILISGVISEVLITGRNFTTHTVGRFRDTRETLTSANCVILDKGSVLLCQYMPPSGVTGAYFDLSLNSGMDFIPAFAHLQVVEPVIIKLLSNSIYNTDAIQLLFLVVDFRSAYAMSCIISNGEITTHAPIVYRNASLAICTFEQDLNIYEDTVLTVTQGLSFIVLGPQILNVFQSPILDGVVPDTLLVNTLTPITFSFATRLNLHAAMQCVLLGDVEYYFPARYINSSIAVCSVQAPFTGVVNVTLLFEGLESGISTELVVRPNFSPLSSNTSLVLNHVESTIQVTSSACDTPDTVTCLLDNILGVTAFNDGCTILCTFFLATSKSSVKFSLFHPLGLETAYFIQQLTVVQSMIIIDMAPSAGITLGGTILHLYGSGLMNYAGLRCVFGDIAVDAFAVSHTDVACIAPPSPGTRAVHVSLVIDSIIVGSSPILFSYRNFISIQSVSPSTVLAIGGNTVIVSVGSQINTLPIDCRFDNVTVKAVLNGTNLWCTAPALLYGSKSFCLVVAGAVVSDILSIHVVPTPAVIHFEPYLTQAMSPVNLTLVMSQVYPDLIPVCLVDGISSAIVTEGVFYKCVLLQALPSGSHSVELFIGGVQLFKTSLISNLLSIKSVYPSVDFSTSRNIVTLVSSTPFNARDSFICKFGESMTNARLVSQFMIECPAPVLDILTSLIVPIGIMGTDRYTQDTGFHFTFIRLPPISSIGPLFGSYMGRTVVVIHFMSEINFPVYGRIGTSSNLCDTLSTTSIGCVTRTDVVGEVEIEVSVNGIFFESTGYQYHYLPALPITASASSALTTSSVIAGVAPVILYIQVSDILSIMILKLYHVFIP
jgi:hypothetical protein